MIIVTGYAASGKTTLSNLLLRSEPGLRTGVIAHRQVEEYGIAPHPIALDGCAAYDEVYDFGSGCICCSPSGELTRLLQAWADRLHEGTLSLDLLIIKAAPLASALVFARCLAAASGRVGERFSLASIVAVVSPGLAVRHLAADSPKWQARRQLQAADLVVVAEATATAPGAAEVEELVRAQSQARLLWLPAEACPAAWAAVAAAPLRPQAASCWNDGAGGAGAGGAGGPPESAPMPKGMDMLQQMLPGVNLTYGA